MEKTMETLSSNQQNQNKNEIETVKMQSDYPHVQKIPIPIPSPPTDIKVYEDKPYIKYTLNGNELDEEYSHYYGHYNKYKQESQINKTYKQVLSDLTEGNLLEDGPVMANPTKIKLPLKLHQRRMLYELTQKEQQPFRTSDSINLGILSDKVGAGKSLEILSLIAHARIPETNSYASNKLSIRPHHSHDKVSKISGYNFQEEDIIPTNLIVVPHGIYIQWENYIKIHTSLSFTPIMTKKDVDSLTTNILFKNEITLIKATQYNLFIKKVADLIKVKQSIKQVFIKNYYKNESREIYKIYDKIIDKIKSIWNTISYLETQFVIPSSQWENVTKQMLDINDMYYSPKKTFFNRMVHISKLKKTLNELDSEDLLSKYKLSDEIHYNIGILYKIIVDKKVLNELSCEILKKFKNIIHPDKIDKDTVILPNIKRELKGLYNLLTDFNFNKIKEGIKHVSQYQLMDIKQVKSYVFARTIFDEANSINIAGCEPAYSIYNWFISSSLGEMAYPTGLTYFEGNTRKTRYRGIKHTGFIRDTMMRNAADSIPHFIQFNVFKNSDNFIEQSFKLPDPVINYTHCYTPQHLKIVHDVPYQDVVNALNANDKETALKLLGCEVTDTNDIVDLVLYKIKEEASTLEEKIEHQNNKFEICTKQVKELKNLKERGTSSSIYQYYVTNNIINHEDNEDDEDDEVVNINNQNNNGTPDISEVIASIRSKTYQAKKLIEKYEGELHKTNTRIESIEERITNVDKKECTICLSPPENPAMVPCCHNMFCLECLTDLTNTGNSNGDDFKCPMCREKCNMSRLVVVDDKLATTSKEKIQEQKDSGLKSKLDNIIEIIKGTDSDTTPLITPITIKTKGKVKTKSKAKTESISSDTPLSTPFVHTMIDNDQIVQKDRKFLIFTQFDNTFKEIEEKLETSSIISQRLIGTGAYISKTVERFNSGETKVLMLNAKHYGAGLNLQTCTDIIIYHKMTDEMEQQLVGRGQRLGRTSQLRVHRLCYDHEL
jgi:hypothetical protein